MIGTSRLSVLTWLVGPLALAAMAAGQEARPAPKETSVPVTEGSVTVVEGGKKPAESRSATARQALREAAEAQREKARESQAEARAAQAKARARIQLATPRQAPGFKPGDPHQYWAHLDPVAARVGLELAETDEALRSQLQLKAAPGVVVVAVTPQGAGDRSGIRPNDVITTLGDAPVRSVDQARTRLLGLGKEPLDVRLIRGGRPVQVSLAGPEHGAGSAPELTEFWIGVPITPVDAILRSQLPDLPAETGLIVNEVVPESPAAKAGLMKNDILVRLANKPLKDSASLIAQVQSAGEKPTALEILRAGKLTTVTITPARRARAAAFNAVAADPNAAMLTYYNFYVPRPGVAVGGFKQQGEIAGQIEKAVEGLKLEGLDKEAVVKQIEKAMESLKLAQGAGKPVELHLEMMNTDPLKAMAKAEAPDVNAKVEATMKELKASIDELKKAIEGLKKPEDKKPDKE